MKIIFETNKNKWISKAIIYFTKSNDKTGKPISHAAPIFGEAFGCEWGLSADEILISVVDINRYRNPGYMFRIYEIPDRVPKEEWIPKLTNKYNQNVYPHLELLWFIYRWFRRKFQSDYVGKNWFSYSEFCSELTILALRKAGYEKELEGIDENVTDAIELENIVRNMPEAKLIECFDY